jgi:hypothetical protein
MTGLAAFLTARLDEDEAAAVAGAGSAVYGHMGDTAAEEVLGMAVSEGCSGEGIEHLERWLPARVLAEVAAKRAIVDDYQAIKGHRDTVEDEPKQWAATHMIVVSLRSVLAQLANVYAKHPDYREEWKS